MDELGKLMVVYSRNLPKLRAAAYSVVQNMDEAEDVVQDMIVKFVDNPERCRAVDNPLAFLRTCVRNEAISHLRKKSNETPAFDFVLASAKATVAAEEYKKIESLLYVRSYAEQMSPACGLTSMNGLNSASMAKKCLEMGVLFTDASQLQAGDIIFFARKDASRGVGYCTDHRRCGTGKCKRYLQIHHVAIYINDTFLIDSTGGNNSVQIRKHWGKNGSEWEWVCFGRPTA